MEITLSKVIPLLIYPFNLALWCLLIAWLGWLVRRRGVAMTSLTVALAILGVAGNPRTAQYLLRNLEQQNPPVAINELPAADAILVLGGGIGIPLPPRHHIDLGGSADRYLHAARLYRSGKAPRIVLSGGNVFPQPGFAGEAAYAAQLLQDWNVPEGAILVESESRNTYQNAVESKKLLANHGLKKILLVTSASHMPRALAVFRRQGVDAIPATTDVVVVDSQQPAVLEWLPSIGALAGTTHAVHEHLGTWYYRIRGWI